MKRFAYPNPEQWERKTHIAWVQIPKGLTIGEIPAWAEEHGVPPTATMSAVCHVGSEAVETDEQYAARIERMEAAERRHREFILKRYQEIRDSEKESEDSR